MGGLRQRASGISIFAKPQIGLLGGSFNPAHEGHLHISLMALQRLGLDEVWWLVSPSNPLKKFHDLAPYDSRLAGARKMACHPRITVSDFEARAGTRYTIHTLRALMRRFGGVRFVWIAGADILIEMPLWRDWEAIFRAVPIAIFDRPTYSLKALSGLAAQRFGRAHLPERHVAKLAKQSPPAWTFIPGRRNPASATKLRKGGA
jgi:nicotinate-nucleotide adenylyltransferase